MKFFIYYSNGYFEAIDKISITFLHLVEIGAAKFIIDFEAKEIYLPVGDGTSKKVKIHEVTGLS